MSQWVTGGHFHSRGRNNLHGSNNQLLCGFVEETCQQKRLRD